MSEVEVPIHPECQRFKVRGNIDLYVTAPSQEEADLYAMKYMRRGMALNHQQGFTPDILLHPGTGLLKQGRVTIYHPRA